MGLTLLVGTLAIQVVLPAMRWSTRSQSRGQLQESCYAALQNVRAELQLTNAAAISLTNSSSPGAPVVLAFQPLLQDLPSARPTYLAELTAICWDPSAGTLVRKSWSTDPLGVGLDTVSPSRLKDVQLLSLRTLATSDSKMLAQYVEDFSVTSGTARPNIGNPLKLHLTLKRQVAAGEPDQSTLDSVVYLRNAP